MITVSYKLMKVYACIFILTISLFAMHGWPVGPISEELLIDGMTVQNSIYAYNFKGEKLCFSWFYENHKNIYLNTNCLC